MKIINTQEESQKQKKQRPIKKNEQNITTRKPKQQSQNWKYIIDNLPLEKNNENYPQLQPSTSEQNKHNAKKLHNPKTVQL